MLVVADLFSRVAENQPYAGQVERSNYKFWVFKKNGEQLQIAKENDQNVVLAFRVVKSQKNGSLSTIPGAHFSLNAALAFANNVINSEEFMYQAGKFKYSVVEVNDENLEKLFQRAFLMTELTKLLLQKYVPGLDGNSTKVAIYTPHDAVYPLDYDVVRIGVSINAQTSEEAKTKLMIALQTLSGLFDTRTERLEFERDLRNSLLTYPPVTTVNVGNQEAHMFCPLQFPKLTMAIHHRVGALIGGVMRIEEIAGQVIGKTQEEKTKCPWRLPSATTGHKRHNGKQERPLCPLCCTNKIEYIAFPCGHYCYCHICSIRVFERQGSPQCYFCNQPIEKMTKVIECE